MMQDSIEEKVLVSVQCLVYNHASYLRQCLDGFVMQKTSFKYEVIVHDDASTDGSSDIIREYAQEYPGLFKIIIQTENIYSKGISPTRKYILPLCTGKYIAMCEGDDYWTDPYKLQKQVDFMELHPDYVACFHNAVVDYGRGRKRLFNDLNENQYPTTEDIIERPWFISTQTLLYRNIHLVYPEWKSVVKNGDYLLELLLAKEGKFYYIDDVMAVYRKHGQGVSAVMNSNQVKMYEGLIFLLTNMKEWYGGTYADSFDRSIANYEQQKEDSLIELYYEHHPLARVFRIKTYKRAIRNWLKRMV